MLRLAARRCPAISEVRGEEVSPYIVFPRGRSAPPLESVVTLTINDGGCVGSPAATASVIDTTVVTVTNS
jgi:hypothetical protein